MSVYVGRDSRVVIQGFTGQHATFHAERILMQHMEVDAVVLGEGEETICALVDHAFGIRRPMAGELFPMAASASTNATIASATTAAAGTAQTSLRSTAAGLSVIVARSTDRSGFISVAIGFM